MSTVSDAKKAWEQGPLARTLKKAPERKPEFATWLKQHPNLQ